MEKTRVRKNDCIESTRVTEATDNESIFSGILINK